jgi:hypothetical protein
MEQEIFGSNQIGVVEYEPFVVLISQVIELPDDIGIGVRFMLVFLNLIGGSVFQPCTAHVGFKTMFNLGLVCFLNQQNLFFVDVPFCLRTLVASGFPKIIQIFLHLVNFGGLTDILRKLDLQHGGYRARLIR